MRLCEACCGGPHDLPGPWKRDPGVGGEREELDTSGMDVVHLCDILPVMFCPLPRVCFIQKPNHNLHAIINDVVDL